MDSGVCCRDRPLLQSPATMPDDATNSPAWDERLLRNPHAAADKRSRVKRMFAAIAPSYDLNNRLHSLWMDQYWRRVAVRLAKLRPEDHVVDVACGTGDLSLRFARQLRVLNAGRDTHSLPANSLPFPVIGVDFTYEMLPLARRKTPSIRVSGSDPDGSPDVETQVNLWVNGDALALPLADGSADVVSIAFGIRNVTDPAAAIREFARILKPGGRLVILEFSLPNDPLLRRLYNFYFRKVLPVTAALISHDHTGAYNYLPESVNTFVARDEMTRMMREAGFVDVQYRVLTLGVCVCYVGVAPARG
jgi:demethylmenaquinone methyltransferase / 2-methoxy-6-polyprenyl-1,4-benzoquinol methylase